MLIIIFWVIRILFQEKNECIVINWFALSYKKSWDDRYPLYVINYVSYYQTNWADLEKPV